MSDKDIFDENNKDDEPVITNDEPITPDEPTADQLLAKIVNEDGTPKYNSIAEALVASEHAQKHIKTLEADNSALKDKGNASDKLDELLEAVKNQSKGSGKDEGDVSAMNPKDVLGIVKEYLDDTKASETRTNNINMVAKAFKDRFGKDASEKLYGKADDLGFSRSEINGMIAQNPNAALTILGVEMKQAPNKDVVTTPSSVDAAQFRGTPDETPASVMDISSSKDLTDAWKASQERTLKRLGLTEK